MIGPLTILLAMTATPEIYFQSHRGGLNEVPENTLVAMEHSWGIPGAVPEVDLRTTSDGVIVCLHDSTPARTTNADPEWADTPISRIPYEVVKTWDAGAWFDDQYAGTCVPTLDEVFTALKAEKDRLLYLDLKSVELDALFDKIREADVEEQILFVHGMPRMCARLQGTLPRVRTMTWISGDADAMKKRFAELADTGFEGISQLQFHLHPVEEEPVVRYDLSDEYLSEARMTAALHGTALQVRPFTFTPESLRRLVDLGIHWYVSDDPKAFREAVDAALALRPGPSESAP
jgi:glycerophosphoryl diester phosphodiesterase